jgi:hypothetical protein
MEQLVAARGTVVADASATAAFSSWVVKLTSTAVRTSAASSAALRPWVRATARNSSVRVVLNNAGSSELSVTRTPASSNRRSGCSANDG